MKKYRVKIEGMTCTGCEEHITEELQKIGANNIEVSFRHGRAIFELLDEVNIEKIKKAIIKAKYIPSEIEEIESKEKMVLGVENDYDYVIIGSGSAAFSSAIKAVEYGAKVAMIERGTIGGTCVNIGCVPSKTMLRAGEINHFAKSNPFIGLNTSADNIDLSKLIEQKNKLVKELRQQKYIDLLNVYGIEMITGEAKFISEKTVEVNNRKISAKRFLIATGASPVVPNIPGLDEVDYLTSTTLLELKEIPKTLAIIGAGFIGLEMGNLFKNFGVKVTVIQRGNNFLKNYDPEIADTVRKFLREKGIKLITGVEFEQVKQIGDKKQVHILVDGEKKIIEADQLLIATGRKPNTARLDLYKAGVEVGSREEVKVDEYLRTTNPRIYAAGDVTMGPQFVYVAAYQGGIAADNALGGYSQKVNLEVVPGVTFTNPSIATVGFTEKQAIEKGYEVKTSILPLDAIPRALANHETTGIFKLVADAKTQKILGVHVVAENAGEVIYAATLAVKFGLTIEDLRESLAPYLTMAEGLKLASLTFDKDISKLSCCAG
ncbi:mercury(II) reductase [Vulcanibacillus modesticaldus]|uniref:Mercuric reductase n=1 Tax=Vulcanibacillus modesticaldus TaxID=337097 RepID=A0A1D2YWZ0_9BACI|nr:mercury(II) reductase [Vulcanibacillus modesticaldus]OEG00239.1 mercury(II) reductase [Vulcanibacillus modesticaldus]